MSYLIYVHLEFDDRLEYEAIRERKEYVHWSQLQLATTGSTPRVKGVVGHEYGWRRTPIKGCQYYLWWIPNKARGIQELTRDIERNAIFIRAIRHHDETENALEFGDLDDYEEISIETIDPRKKEQKIITQVGFQNQFCVKTVQGIPGSGKTVALHYAAKELYKDDQQILYITYTKGLKNAAQDFFDAYKITEKIKIYTFQELTSLIVSNQITESIYKDNLSKFKEFLGQHSAQTSNLLKSWNNNHKRLWIEIRAYLLGMALPFPWKRGDRQLEVSENFLLCEQNYSLLRENILDSTSRKDAFKIANIIVEKDLVERIFPEQYFTKLSLKEILQSSSNYFENLQAIIVDEIQDFTLLQIALIKEIGKQAQGLTSQSQGLTFILAGDESQTVVPSGFDWGVVKDLFHTELKSIEKFPLNQQIRSPYKIAKLIENSWQLYSKYLIRETIPESNRNDILVSNNHNHNQEKLLRWRINSNLDWNQVFDEFQNYTNLAVIDLDDKYTKISPTLSLDNQENANLLTYGVDQIKGLEREIIVILGLPEAISKLSNNYKQYSKNPENKVFLLENRNIIDEIRVALSRSIQTLIIIESEESLLQDELDLIHAEIVDNWDHLKEMALQNQDIDDFEMVNNFLQNAKESRDKDNYEKAKDNILKALEIYQERKLDDQELQEQILKLKRTIDEALVRQSLQSVRLNILSEGKDFKTAEKYIDEYKFSILEINDSSLNNLFISLENRLKIHKNCDQIKSILEENNAETKTEKENILNSFAHKYEILSKENKSLLELINDTNLCEDSIKEINQTENDEVTFSFKIDTVLNSVASSYWYQAKDAIEEEEYLSYSKFLTKFVDIREKQNQPLEFLRIIADRYSNLTPPINNSRDDLTELLDFMDDVTISVPTEKLEQLDDMKIIQKWKHEIETILTEYPNLYSEIRNNVKLIINNKENILNSRYNVYELFIEFAKQTGYLKDIEEIYKIYSLSMTDNILQEIKLINQKRNTIAMSFKDYINSDYYQQLTNQSKEREKENFVKYLRNIFDANKKED